MGDIINKNKCTTEGCDKESSSGVAATRASKYCAQHANNGMIDVRSRKCRTGGCVKPPSFGVAGARTSRNCAQHTPGGMIHVKIKKVQN